jgi:hypothetical protein
VELWAELRLRFIEAEEVDFSHAVLRSLIYFYGQVDDVAGVIDVQSWFGNHVDVPDGVVDFG